jgi:hypothetical protein
MTFPTAVYLLFILAVLFFLPGSALLVLSGTWRRWPGLQGYLAAVGLSAAFYPVFFYAVRFLAPQAVLGPAVLGGLLLLMATVTGWGLWRHAAFSWRLERLEWVAIAVLLLTFLSRFWFVTVYSFPAWSDSLHHTLLTQLTAESGRLPFTLEPYFPNNLRMYHLGLYAISGTAASLTSVPAHVALLWTAQFFNALCGIGIYLVLDRYVSRPGAIVGLAIAGLFSAHPALWVNWGRFTQLSAQFMLPLAWIFLLDLFPQLPRQMPGQFTAASGFRAAFWLVFFAALTAAAVFLFHFRVAAFYLLLVGVTIVYLLWLARSWSERGVIFKRVGAVAVLALLIILPVLWEAGSNYLAARLNVATAPSPAQQAQMRQNYYEFPLSSIPHLAAPVWLLLLAGIGALAGLWRRNWLIGSNLAWILLLIILGNLYLLNIPVLNVTNFGAILIMAYLPLSLIVGAAVGTLVAPLPLQLRRWAVAVGLTALLLASLPAVRTRATAVEEFRHFVTPADLQALTWIQDNVPPGATFAINTYFWLPNFAHGTDAGYWLPYFTGHDIVTSSMIYDGSSPEYRRQVLARSQAADQLKTDLTALDELYQLGVRYVYIGARGNFADAGLQLPLLRQSDQVVVLYEADGAAVLEIVAR